MTKLWGLHPKAVVFTKNAHKEPSVSPTTISCRSTMSIQRSKSAPQSIATPIPATHVPRSYSQENVRAKTTRSARPNPAVAGASLTSPSARTHDGDPFSLGSFFPSSRVSDEDGWTWLPSEHAIQEEPEPMAPMAASMLGPTSDRLAAEAIRNEDKLGVLSIKSPFFLNGKALPADTEDRLFSPYTEDEAIDVESLYQSLCARRRSRGGPGDVKANDFSELFLLDEMETEGTSRWETVLDYFGL